MANKFFKEIQTLRKNIKKLPKNLEEAFTVSQEENQTKVFVASEVQHYVSTNDYIISFIEKCNNDECYQPLSFELLFGEAEYTSTGIAKGTAIEKEVMIFTTELCPALVTIGKILEQNVLPEKKYFFTDDIVFGKRVTKYKTTSLEQYQEDLLNTMIAFRKKAKTI